MLEHSLVDYVHSFDGPRRLRRAGNLFFRKKNTTITSCTINPIHEHTRTPRVAANSSSLVHTILLLARTLLTNYYAPENIKERQGV